MPTRVVHRFSSLLPADDDHPYRTGAWRPNTTEYDATELELIAGAVPRDLAGVYLRNTENPLLPSIGRYHPFDGDGMLHAVHFRDGRADYRNRVVRTRGLLAELAAGRPLWAGLMERPDKSERDGWGARTRMKDASSTDVVVHAGRALTTFYQCGDAYQHDPVTLESLGPASWGGRFPSDWGISAHAKVDEHTGELLFFNYGNSAPYMHYGVVDRGGALVHYVPVALPGPRLPHDMAFTERFVILNDFPLFWDPEQIARGIYRPRYHPELPSRFAVVPRRGRADEVRWFDASPTFVLHWINAFEDGDEVVLDGFHQRHPSPAHHPGDDALAGMRRMLDLAELGSRPHRWRFNLRTGATSEAFLDDAIAEFPTINNRYAGRRNRYAYAVTGEPGWFLFNGLAKYDLERGTREHYAFPARVFASEAPMAPRVAARGEDDGYLVTFVSDLNTDSSECQVFDARALAQGPLARLRLPERICSGTHACWAPADALAGR